MNLTLTFNIGSGSLTHFVVEQEMDSVFFTRISKLMLKKVGQVLLL